MRKAVTLFMVVAVVAVAVVMYMYWKEEAEVITNGVLVSGDIRMVSGI